MPPLVGALVLLAGWLLTRGPGYSLTPLEPHHARAILGAALGAAGIDSPEAARLVSAQSAIETAHWRRVRDWNFGNLVRANWPGASHEFNGRAWRSYPTPEAGAADFVRLLRERYLEAWAVLEATTDAEADADAYAQALKARGYYEETAEAYGRALRGVVRAVGSANG